MGPLARAVAPVTAPGVPGAAQSASEGAAGMMGAATDGVEDGGEDGPLTHGLMEVYAHPDKYAGVSPLTHTFMHTASSCLMATHGHTEQATYP